MVFVGAAEIPEEEHWGLVIVFFCFYRLAERFSTTLNMDVFLLISGF